MMIYTKQTNKRKREREKENNSRDKLQYITKNILLVTERRVEKDS